MQQVIYLKLDTFKRLQNSSDVWADFCNSGLYYDTLGFLGGLDHVEVTANQIILHDRGNNGLSRDIVIRPGKVKYYIVNNNPNHKVWGLTKTAAKEKAPKGANLTFIQQEYWV